MLQTRTPAANTQYRTGPKKHHSESCYDYLQKSTVYTEVNTYPK